MRNFTYRAYKKVLALESFTERKIDKVVLFLENNPDFMKKGLVNWGAILAISVFMSFKIITV
jgi:hypothetical protein